VSHGRDAEFVPPWALLRASASPEKPRRPQSFVVFDKQLALECADLIRQLYQNELTPVINESSTDTQVAIVSRLGRTFVVFPGSASRADWATNLRAGKVPWQPAGRVHAGFREAAESIREELSEHLAGRTYVTFVGHSLGGALATLAADALDSRMPAKIGAVYTFGAPRCGNGPFARSYNARLHDQTFRLVAVRDPIPRIPWLLGTYRHVGTRVWLGDERRLEVNPPLWQGVEWQPLWHSHPEQTVQDFVALSAHSIENYIRKLQESA